MEIEIKRQRVKVIKEVSETVILPELPYYYQNVEKRYFVRVLPVFRYMEQGVGDEIVGMDITISPQTYYHKELKTQRFKLLIEDFADIYNYKAMAYDILMQIVNKKDCYESSKEKFDKELSIACNRFMDDNYWGLEKIHPDLLNENSL